MNVDIPSDFSTGERPSLSLAMTVCHKSPPTILEDICPYLDEIVVTIVGEQDMDRALLRDQRSLWTAWLKQCYGKKPYTVIVVSPESHAKLYLPNTDDTFKVGKPFNFEVYPVYPNTDSDQKFIADWSAVRNIGWSMCSQEFRLAMDDGEVVKSPALLAWCCNMMNIHSRNIAYGSVARSGKKNLSARLARNLPNIRWDGPARESINRDPLVIVFDGALQIKAPLNPPDMTVFRILYADARRRDWDIPLVNLLHLAQTHPCGMSSFALSTVTAYLDNSLYTEERAWACAIRGELHELDFNYNEASKWYERSLGEHPGWKSAFRLARSKFLEKKWQDCLDAYQTGLNSRNEIHLVDNGSEDEYSTLILATSAMRELGQLDEARDGAKLLRQVFPSQYFVTKFCETIES